MNTPKLPSKQFLIRGGIATGIIASILIAQTSWFQGLFPKKDSWSTDGITVGDIVAKDSNGNGIPDWEERLWGLNPEVLYTGDMSNKEIIANKKQALGLTATDSTVLNSTDRLAREFFSVTTSLGQSDQVDSETLSAVAGQLGSSIAVVEPVDTYSIAQLSVIATSRQSLLAYKDKMSTTMEWYSFEQADFHTVIESLETGDYSELPKLGATAINYSRLARTLSKIPVPIGVAQFHLDIINGFAGLANALQYLMLMEEDGVQGMNGIALYSQFSMSLELATEDMNQYLTDYGIL